MRSYYVLKSLRPDIALINLYEKASWKNENSWVWKGFTEALSFIRNNISWKCNWIPYEGGLRKPVSNISNPEIYVKDLYETNKNWDLSKMRSYFNNALDVESIQKIYILGSNLEDKRIWPFS